MALLNEIASWKLDAKFEETSRYFYTPTELEAIINGDKSFVIGRKGSGKTAISENIYNSKAPNVFTEKLTFKNFPFNELYRLSNDNYTRPNQYITMWKYIIYSNICRFFVLNQNIDSDIRNTLGELFGTSDNIINLRTAVSKWIAKEYELKLLGIGGKISLEKSEKGQDWIERVDILEDIISEHIDNSKYYILFDELDEDYKNVIKDGFKSDYIALVTSLFKAVQDIKSVFYNRCEIYPIIFLRDDIYEIILDADKNKWNDFKIELDWNLNELKKLLAFRISRAIDSNHKILEFHDAWKKIFADIPIRFGTKKRKKINTLNYITRSTHLRPRDFVRYLSECADDAIKNNHYNGEGDTLIFPKNVKKVDKAFSNYLRNELVDEIHAVLPDIQEIFAIISEIRKWNFSIQEFRSTYNRRQKLGILTTKDPDFVLQVLYHFSVIGNESRPGTMFFRYKNKEARFNFNERVVVHRGLFKALQII